MTKVLREITPLSGKDCFYIVERYKSEFLFPLHTHEEFELNFIESGKGVQRVVGDSIEEIGDYDLTLIAGDKLEHVWKQGSCTATDVREITIQLSANLLGEGLLTRNQFADIRKMLDRAALGLDTQLLVPEMEDISLPERCRRVNAICQEFGKDQVILLSLHVNAAGNGRKWMNARGWSCYTTRGETAADGLAGCTP